METTLKRTGPGRYEVLDISGIGDSFVWVVRDGNEWHVMRTYGPEIGSTAWIATGSTRRDALEIAAAYDWKGC